MRRRRHNMDKNNGSSNNNHIKPSRPKEKNFKPATQLPEKRTSRPIGMGSDSYNRTQNVNEQRNPSVKSSVKRTANSSNPKNKVNRMPKSEENTAQNKYIKQQRMQEERLERNNHLNFGAVVYFLLFAYIVFLIINSSMSEKRTYSVAEPGTILQEDQFTGLIFRNEQIIKSEQAGVLNYFVPEGEKVKINSYICAIDQDGELEKMLTESINEQKSKITGSSEISEQSLTYLKTQIRNYTLNSGENAFAHLYSAKITIDKAVQDISNTVVVSDPVAFDSAIRSLNMYENQLMSNGSFYQAPISGVISYAIDGLEDINLTTFKTSDLTRESKPLDRSVKKSAEIEDPIYKIVDNDIWYIAAKITDQCLKHLENKSYVTLFFIDKNISIDVQIEKTIKEEDKVYAIFKINRQMNDFLIERHTNFKIVYNKYAGIKIPNSAVEKLGLYAVPDSAVEFEKTNYQVQKKIFEKDKVADFTLKPIQVKVYFKKDGLTYIGPINAATDLSPGEEVVYYEEGNADAANMSFSKLDNPAIVEGIYVINKGYADFKIIETIYQEADYRIINAMSEYGVRIFDKIATDGASVKEYQIIAN